MMVICRSGRWPYSVRWHSRVFCSASFASPLLLFCHMKSSLVIRWELMLRALYCVICLSQEWLCHVRRPVLEIGCLAVLHSWPSLAWCWVPSTFRTTSQIDGVWYDRILHSEVCITSAVVLWSLKGGHLSCCSCVSSGHVMVVTVTCQVAHLQKLKKACYISGMHATVQSRIFCLLFFYLRP